MTRIGHLYYISNCLLLLSLMQTMLVYNWRASSPSSRSSEQPILRTAIHPCSWGSHIRWPACERCKLCWAHVMLCTPNSSLCNLLSWYMIKSFTSTWYISRGVKRNLGLERIEEVETVIPGLRLKRRWNLSSLFQTFSEVTSWFHLIPILFTLFSNKWGLVHKAPMLA